MTTNTTAMSIGNAYYTAIVIANTKIIPAEDYAVAQGCPPVTSRDIPTIVALSNAVATKFPIEFNGICKFVVFPDGSKLAWDEDRGFAHPGN